MGKKVYFPYELSSTALVQNLSRDLGHKVVIIAKKKLSLLLS